MKTKDTICATVAISVFAAFQFAMGFIAGRWRGREEVLDAVTEDLNNETSKLEELRDKLKKNNEEAEGA